MIIIITNKFDVSSDYVVRYLRSKNAPFIRINTEDLIFENVTVSISDFTFALTNKQKNYDLTRDVTGFFLRRPGKPFEFSKSCNRPSRSVQKYVENQWHPLLESLRFIKGAFWINDPLKNHQAENKISQLKLACELGFQIPKTCITTSKAQVIQFSKSCPQGIIAKALCTPLIEEPKKTYFVYTTKIESIEGTENQFHVAPTIFQEVIADKVDYRVTIVGSKCFAVKIQTGCNNAIPLDWRTAKEGLRYTPVTLPTEVENKCVEIVRTLGLVFGAIDLLERHGEFFFLEINPNGEWGWLQKNAQLPIAESLGDLLIHGN